MAAEAVAARLTLQEAPAVVRLASPNGTVTRAVLPTAPRDAWPSEIPVIDISPIFGDSFAQRQDVARQIRSAATSNGVFYISNHGIPPQVIDDVYNAGLDFFRQDTNIKLEAKVNDTKGFVGYYPPMSMKINPFEGKDLKEIFITRYNPSLDPTVGSVEQIPEAAKKHFHYQDIPWAGTASVPHFQTAMIRAGPYQSSDAKHCPLTGPFEDYYDEKMRYPNLLANINYYPAMEAPTGAACGQVPGFGTHTDFQIITVLWQDDVGGLQVLDTQGQWINVIPVKDTLVVNVADLLQRITNDVYVSTVHRAQNKSNRERISITLPTSFGAHETVTVVKTCLGPDESTKYNDVTVEAWSTKRLETMIRMDQELPELQQHG